MVNCQIFAHVGGDLIRLFMYKSHHIIILFLGHCVRKQAYVYLCNQLFCPYHRPVIVIDSRRLGIWHSEQWAPTLHYASGIEFNAVSR